MNPFADAIRSRVEAAGLPVDAVVITGCAEYLRLLGRWNRRLNLTALRLDEPVPEATVDKLIVEPLLAASLLTANDQKWLDLGSGGGSPAIPLRLLHTSGTLRMVESRGRKCAFLREAVRVLNLAATDVFDGRVEELAAGEDADLITIRALRVDAALLQTLGALLRRGGRVFAFGGWPAAAAGFEEVDRRPLPDGSALQVAVRR